jgi:hypothetical protein
MQQSTWQHLERSHSHLCGSVGTVGCPEGVVDEKIKGGGQLGSELGVILGLFSVEAGVLEEEYGLMGGSGGVRA